MKIPREDQLEYLDKRKNIGMDENENCNRWFG